MRPCRNPTPQSVCVRPSVLLLDTAEWACRQGLLARPDPTYCLALRNGGSTHPEHSAGLVCGAAAVQYIMPRGEGGAAVKGRRVIKPPPPPLGAQPHCPSQMPAYKGHAAIGPLFCDPKTQKTTTEGSWLGSTRGAPTPLDADPSLNGSSWQSFGWPSSPFGGGGGD